MALPDPPLNLRPRVVTWPAKRSFSRIHPAPFRPTELLVAFQASVEGRFHFFERADTVVVPVLYGAETIDAVIAEVVFRRFPIRGSKRRLKLKALKGLALSHISPKRDLSLIELCGHGLRRLEVTAEELTSSSAAEYPRTVAWAKRLYESVRRADGLLWMSRQFNSAQALMLFGDRVEQDDLDHGEPLELSYGEGRALVEAAAIAAGIIIAT